MISCPLINNNVPNILAMFYANIVITCLDIPVRMPTNIYAVKILSNEGVYLRRKRLPHNILLHKQEIAYIIFLGDVWGVNWDF